MKETNSPKAEAAYAFFSHARFAHALSLVIIGTAFGTHALRSLMGTAGLITLIFCELLLSILALIARRRAIKWDSVIPITLLAFLIWSLISYFWSYYPRATLLGLASQLSFASLALVVVNIRDVLQIIRALGDVLRFYLAVSLILEIVAGILIDSPITFLGIKGNLITGSGIQGLFGSRNSFMMVSIIALITFIIEWRTKSIPRELAMWSIIGGIICLWLGASPTALLTLFAVAVAAVVIYLAKKAGNIQRRKLEIMLSITVGVSFVFIWAFRGSVIAFLGAMPAFRYRFALWLEEWRLATMKPLEGWGWTGIWPRKTQPFTIMSSGNSPYQNNGLNAYLDVWVQLGFVGLVLLSLMILITFGRLWRLSCDNKSLTSIWPILIFTALITIGVLESSILYEFGWFMFLICVSIGHQFRKQKRVKA